MGFNSGFKGLIFRETQRTAVREPRATARWDSGEGYLPAVVLNGLSDALMRFVR